MGVYPRNFVGEKFQEIKNTGDGDDRGMTQHFK